MQTVGRQWGWDFARNLVTLVLSGNVAPFPWSKEYLYPTNGIEVWQVLPATLADPNDPRPINFVIGNAEVAAVQKKVIWCDLASAHAVFNNNPTPDVWDPLFREAVIRHLGSELAMALAGRPDTSSGLLQTGHAFGTMGQGRPD